ncbi:hypothetical protein [Leptolyngbya sp. 7M]|uniref:hypothetical protein n=1 Tax=Leptolyngbya sp. 7M TaxID=2812896 RepID=UPI001B8B7050|nr:hypothetical protein [Leptolyngbya sp. 7M]QYO63224.1 hypothetical protein JVX88_25245 [Leptolyngbya sp. 7M]
MSYDNIRNFGRIRLAAEASVDASGVRGGAVQVQGGQISLSNGSQIVAFTHGAQRGRPIRIAASDSLTVQDILSSIRTETDGPGTAGTVAVSTRRLTIRNGGRIGSIP